MFLRKSLVDEALLRDIESQVQRSSTNPVYLALGTGLESRDARHDLVAALANVQKTVPNPVVLATARGSIAQSPFLVAELVQHHLDLRVMILWDEWLLGSELILGAWQPYADAVRITQRNIHGYVAPRGNVERLQPQRYVPSMAVDWLTHRRCRKLMRELNVPQIRLS